MSLSWIHKTQQLVWIYPDLRKPNSYIPNFKAMKKIELNISTMKRFTIFFNTLKFWSLISYLAIQLSPQKEEKSPTSWSNEWIEKNGSKLQNFEGNFKTHLLHTFLWQDLQICQSQMLIYKNVLSWLFTTNSKHATLNSILVFLVLLSPSLASNSSQYWIFI